jgi:uncharacterized protein (UPF0128 family)
MHKSKLQRLKQRYGRLKHKLQTIDYLLQGTIQEHQYDRKLANGQHKQYGPYFAWTFKLDGKTVTVTLTKHQARAYRRAILNQKKLNRILHQMRTLSLTILEASHSHVNRRKSRDFLPQPP